MRRPEELKVQARLVREVFRRVVRDLRKETPHPRLTQAELAARLGISRYQLVAIEGGRRVLSEANLVRLLAAFEIDLSEFLEVAAWTAIVVERPLSNGATRTRGQLLRMLAARHLREARALAEVEATTAGRRAPNPARRTPSRGRVG